LPRALAVGKARLAACAVSKEAASGKTLDRNGLPDG
jgi:hypothetical protein